PNMGPQTEATLSSSAKNSEGVTMQYGKWETIKELGHGGQGTVYTAKDTEDKADQELVDRIRKTLIETGTGGTAYEEVQFARVRRLLDDLKTKLNPKTDDPKALKALRQEHGEREKALGRMKREIEVLQKSNQPK